MKKILVSVGLAAAGAASIQSVLADGLDLISPNSWSVSGNLRGFYDDNYNVAPGKKGSFGAEVSPSVSYNLPLRQTDFGIRYTYALMYYQDREDLSLNPFDQTHQVDLWYDHAINEKWHLNASDTFASGQEPELIGQGQNAGIDYRVNGNNIGNHFKMGVDTQWTPLFGTSLHYQNDFYHFSNTGAGVTNAFTGTTIATPYTRPASTPGKNGQYNLFNDGNGASLGGLLNRVDQNVGLDFIWTLNPTTKLLAGYSFDLDTYIAHEPIAIYNYNVPAHPTENQSLVYQSDSRDTMIHQLYVGAQYNITGNLSLMGNLGVEYVDSYNDPMNDNNNSFDPTANVSLTYTYTTGSYAQLGVQQSENSTYVTALSSSGDITLYQYTTTVYADINQKIFERLMATVIGRYEYSTYQGGLYGNDEDNYYSLGVNLSYQINRHFSAEVGYNYDDLQSEVPGNGYNRNRVYIGLGANY
jgi:hypothetical protein